MHADKTPTSRRSTAGSLRHRHPAAPSRLGRSSALFALTLAFGFGALAASPAVAGFLDDYYEAAGAQTSVTQPAIVESSSMNLVTGGSFVVKVPRKTFTPFTFEAPSLKAGCGGIDLFLGGFSIPSKDEFVSFLRSIGTALPGLAFQLALQSMSPDLNEQVTSFRDMLMKISQGLANSCEAGAAVLDMTGAAGQLRNAGHWAANALRASGEAEDASDASSMTRIDGAKVMASVPERKDAGGAVVSASEINLTWALLKGGRFASAGDEYLEVMMTMLGTTIYRKAGSGESTTVASADYAARDLLHELYAPGDESDRRSIEVLACDEPVKCLSPKWTKRQDVNLVAAVKKAADHYRRSLLLANKGEVTARELQLLANISSIPLLGIVEASASPQIEGLSEAYMSIYAEAAAYEGIMNALTNLGKSVEETLQSSSGITANATNQAHAERLRERIRTVVMEMQSLRQSLYQALANARELSAQVEHIRRSVYGQSAVEVAAQMPASAVLR